MLTGKIIKIWWFGDAGWGLMIDGLRKTFDTDYDMYRWLVSILDKVKDLRKKQLLIDDLSKFLILGEH